MTKPIDPGAPSARALKKKKRHEQWLDYRRRLKEQRKIERARIAAAEEASRERAEEIEEFEAFRAMLQRTSLVP